MSDPTQVVGRVSTDKVRSGPSPIVLGRKEPCRQELVTEKEEHLPRTTLTTTVWISERRMGDPVGYRGLILLLRRVRWDHEIHLERTPYVSQVTTDEVGFSLRSSV